MVVNLKQYFGWPDQPSSSLDVTKQKNLITIVHSGGYRNTYFETKSSGGNDEQNN